MKKFIIPIITICISGLLAGCDNSYDCDDKEVLKLVREHINIVGKLTVNDIVQRDGKHTKGLKVCNMNAQYEHAVLGWHVDDFIYTVEPVKRNGQNVPLVKFYYYGPDE